MFYDLPAKVQVDMLQIFEVGANLRGKVSDTFISNLSAAMQDSIERKMNEDGNDVEGSPSLQFCCCYQQQQKHRDVRYRVERS